MKDFDRILPIKRAAQGRLLAMPGVHSVGIGLKIVGGKRTEEPAIMVFVVKKKPLSELRPEEVIPAEIEGVKTDVYESDIPRSRAIDDSSARPLLGGVQLEPGGFSPTLVQGTTVAVVGGGVGGFGTLGCLALTGGAHPSLMAITCHHVVGAPVLGITTNLTPNLVPPNITFEGSNTEGSLVVVNISIANTNYDVFYRTSAADTLQTIASAVAAQIGMLGVAGLTAAVTPPGSATVQLSAVGTGGPVSYNCSIYSPPTGYANAGVQASISGTSISLTGQASQACAAYVNFNVGGAKPTYGVFVPIAASANASTVADSITSAITNLIKQLTLSGVTGLSGVTAIVMLPASPGGPYVVSVSGVQEVECNIASDVRVGQPDNTFCSKCCKCCDDRIGNVVAARIDLDVALIQVDPVYVKQYLAEIKDIGNVRGTLDVTQKTSGYALQKRGRTTQVKHGTLLALDQDGDTTNPDEHNTPPKWTLFSRHYSGAFTIQGTGFSEGGDSGAAVVTDTSSGDADYNKVVGILFASTDNETWATPILPILSAFPALGLTLATATATGMPQSVPPIVDAAPAQTAASPAQAAGSADMRPLAQLTQAQEEINATPAGRRYSELVQRHLSEVQTLVNQNRRVATVWRRNGGPQIARHVLRMVESPEDALPWEVNGKPLPECLADIRKALSRYGSPALAADLAEYGPPLSHLAGLSFRQTLDTLRGLEIE